MGRRPRNSGIMPGSANPRLSRQVGIMHQATPPKPMEDFLVSRSLTDLLQVGELPRR